MGKKTWGMSFHTDTYSVLRVSRAHSPIMFNYILKGQELQVESPVKYLGVNLASNLSWNPHIDRAVKKANSVLGFLKRNLLVKNSETKCS